MKLKPKFFSIEVKIGDYIFYQSESDKHTRVYVPRTKDDFNEFIEVLWNLLPKEYKTAKTINNYNLIKKYPWLFVKNRWDGGVYIYNIFFEESEISFNPNKYNNWFRYFEGDWIYESKPKLFIKFQNELLKELQSYNKDLEYQYTIVDTKIKWGTLRWYDGGNTNKGRKIVSKYLDKLTKKMKLKSY